MSDVAQAAAGGPVGPPAPLTVALYGRPGCHLCDDALAVIERVRARVPFVLWQRDIESDPTLFTRFLERIPVVEIAGRVEFELFVDEVELERRLEARRGRISAEPPLE